MSQRYPHLRFADLEFTGFVAHGGMCEVREAWWTDPQGRDAQGRPQRHHVAVKVLLPEHRHNPDLKRRFQLEADLLYGRLQHPCIVWAFAMGTHEDQLYLVMEWADLTLADAIDSRLAERRSGCAACHGEAPHRYCPEPFPGTCQMPEKPFFGPAEIVALMDPVRRALAYTHDHGIIHRDIKPSNILLVKVPDEKPQGPPGVTAAGEGRICLMQDGVEGVFRVVLTDFGIVRDQAARSTTGMAAMGTSEYMSPEQVQGQPLTKRSDVYSMGALLYELLTGRYPFRGESLTVMNAHVHSIAPPPSTLNRHVLKGFDVVCDVALAKAEDSRWDDANELFAAIKKASLGFVPERPGPPEPRPSPPPPPPPPPPPGKGWLWGVGAAALLLGVAWLKPWSEPPPPPVRVETVEERCAALNFTGEQCSKFFQTCRSVKTASVDLHCKQRLEELRGCMELIGSIERCAQ